MHNITIINGDIATAQTDAIVNAANPVMLGGSGVDGAIHRAAGPDLLAECEKVPVIRGIRCPIGEARITSAGKLPARFVIHTVGPRYQLDPEPAELLACAYCNSLRLALENRCTSVAFPAISCGIYGYPAKDAAEVALLQCAMEEFSGLSISFYLFSREMTSLWESMLAQLQRA